jgi:hypothetical protein
MKRRWKGVCLFWGGTIVAVVLMRFSPPPIVILAVGIPAVLCMSVGKLWMSQYAFGESDE